MSSPPDFDTLRWARFVVTAIQGIHVVASTRPEREILDDIVAAKRAALRAAADRGS